MCFEDVRPRILRAASGNHSGGHVRRSSTMSSFSVGDEVRFRTSPDVIDDGQHVKSQSWTKYTSRPPGPSDRRARLQAVVNKEGLIELNLSGKGTRDIPREVYSLLRLEVLKVNDNKIHSLSSAISHLHKLRVIHAQKNAIQSLPDTLTNCIHLQELDLANNRLFSLPASLSQLHKLKVLKLSHNNFESLPHELGDLSSLQKLELAGNKLWHLPYSMQDLRHLRYLSLAENLFEQLPICICFIQSLEALDARKNKLINLPPDFDSLKNLKELSLAHNKLETMPYMLPHLKNIHSLDLGYNRIKNVPPRVAKLAKLKMLMIQGNAISSLPNTIETLEYLNVAENRLHNFSVARMKRLRYLNASNNSLENVPLGVYNLRYLEVLKLDNNKISYLSQDVVLLKRLKNMDLGNNQLTSLPNVINELENLETFNVKGNRIETRPGGHANDTGRGRLNPVSRPSYPTSQPNIRGGNPQYMTDHYQDLDDGFIGDGGGRHYRRNQSPPKKKSNWRDKFTLRRKSPPRPAHYDPHSRHTGTQYTPKSSVKSRERPPLDYKPSTNSLSSILSLPKSKHSQTQTNTAEKEAKSMAGISNAPTAVMVSNPLSVSEISYPMGSAPLQQHLHAPGPSTSYAADNPGEGTSQSNHVPNGPTNAWSADRKVQHASIRSDTVTINSTVGDELSLGDEDFEYQPTTVADDRLIGVCAEVEGMLNKQLLQPFTQTRGIFRKGMNEDGTLRTLNSITSGSLKRYSHGNTSAKIATADGVVHMNNDQFLRQKSRSEPNLLTSTIVTSNGLSRSKIDAFKVTPAGGLFRAAMDTKVTIYFPINAVETPLTFTMQLEQVDPAAVEQAKHQEPHVDNLVAVGDIVHIKQSRPVNFEQQVTITLPAPMTAHKGRLHLLIYHEDNTCSPSSSHFKIHHGYITVQAWHFSGIGAVITKSKSKYKACKSVERLLQCLYV